MPTASRIGDEVIDMGPDVGGRRVREAALAASTAVDGVHREVAWRRQEPRQAGQLAGGGQRSVEEQDMGRAGADGAIREADATGSVEAVLAWSGRFVLELRPIGRAPDLAVRRQPQVVDPGERHRHLGPREPFDAERGQGVVTRVRHLAPEDDVGDGDVTEGRVAASNDGRAVDRGMIEQHRFDFRR